MKVETLKLTDKKGIERQGDSFVLYEGLTAIRISYSEADTIIKFIKYQKSTNNLKKL